MISIVIFEDNKVLRQSLTLYFNNTEGIHLAGAYEDANEAVAKIRKHRPDVVLMDVCRFTPYCRSDRKKVAEGLKIAWDFNSNNLPKV